MKKLLAILAICLLAPGVAWGATYLWCKGSTGAFTETAWNTATDCAGDEVVAPEANGDIYVANGQTVSIADDIGSAIATVTLTTEGTDYGGTDGGGFTVATDSVAALTIYTNITAGSTDCLLITGAGAGNDTTELTIIGNILAGTTSGADGVYATNTSGKVIITGSITGNSGIGYYKNSNSGNMTITGNITGATSATAIGFVYSDSISVATVNGDCIGGAGSSAATGCSGSAGSGTTASITINGNIINSTRASGAVGKIVWNPTAPANGVTGHCIKFDGGGTAVFAGKNTDDATKALSTFYYIDPTDGTSDQGSAASGGGAWAN